MEDLEGQIAMKVSYELLYEPGKGELTMSFVCQSSTPAMRSGEGSLFAGNTCMRRAVWVLPLLLLWSRTYKLALCCSGPDYLVIRGGVSTHDPVSMVRERARSRRGSAWEAHRAQRQRKQHLERALTMASSILRRRARVERRRLLDSIVERKAGCSRDDSQSNLSSARDGEKENDWPSCIVEEDPSIGDLPSMELPRDMNCHNSNNNCPAQTITRDNDVPGCLVEEIPWPPPQAEVPPDNATREEQGMEAAGLQEDSDPRNAPRNGSGGELHGFHLSDEHLALVYELRSHLADTDFRMLLMHQRLDILLGALSGVPAQHKCPLCMQEFVIPARHNWQMGEDDSAKDI
jgi:hypothetical protein